MHQGPPVALNETLAAPSRDELEVLWDAIVVGAGPAGTLVGRELARAGLSTLIVERESWPRSKVCGSYVNGRAASVLEAVGLGSLLQSAGGVPIRDLELRAGGRPALVRLSGRGCMLSRVRLDAELLNAARDEGARFLPATRARARSKPGKELGGDKWREVDLALGSETVRTRARVLIFADGLAGGADPDANAAIVVAESSRIGLGAYLDDNDWLPAGRIAMACAPGGYVGAARVEDGRLCLAAAVDPGLLARGPKRAVTELFEKAGVDPPPSLEDVTWKGTPPLTRSARRVASWRSFRVGDAAGYVEPFTGEGIAWALEGACRLSSLVRRVLRVRGSEGISWEDAAALWERGHKEMSSARRAPARTLARLMRRPRTTRLVVAALARAPRLGSLALRPFVEKLDEPLDKEGLATHIT